MKRQSFYLVLLMCLMMNFSAAQSTSLSEVVAESVETYIHYRDSFDNSLELKWGRSPIDKSNNHSRYILPELIGANDLQFPPTLKDEGISLVWVKSRFAVKRLLRKNRSSNYHGYYMVAINIEDGEFVVYVMTGCQGKVGETLQGRFSYGIKDGDYLLHTIDFQWKDVEQTYHNPDVGKVVPTQTIEKMFAIFLRDSLTTEMFSDTIDILQSNTKWRKDYLPEERGVHYTYQSLLSEKTLLTRTKPFLAIDYTFNQQGDILVYFRTLFCQKQKGKYKNLQQQCTSALVFTLSQDVSGMYQITSYKHVGGNKRGKWRRCGLGTPSTKQLIRNNR